LKNIKKVTRDSHPALFNRCKSLGSLIVALEKEGETESLFITKIFLNEKIMDSEEEKLLDSLSITEINSLKVVYSQIKEIICQSIQELVMKIQDIQQLSIKFSRELRKANKVNEEKIKFILIECRSIIDSLEHIFSVHTSGRFLLKHHSLWIEAERELTNVLHCILQSRHMDQPGFIADLIEFDLVQALDVWDEVLEKELVDNPTFTGIFRLKNNQYVPDNGADA